MGNNKNLISQSDFYDIDSIQEIKLYFDDSNWDELLDSLYIEGLKNRLEGTAIINGTIFNNVGVRYKGFSSYSSARTKNPFNIALDYVKDDASFQGFNKVKLSNVIQDPSFVREVLSYEIARKYMPASRSNFANVYVNDTLIGLYTNVEAVNKDFLQDHFTSRSNTFVKCNPESLDLNGENSNLSDSPGSSSTYYEPFYDLKSNDNSGWNDLVRFIDTLNQSQQNIESMLNVDRTLWMHAFNYSVINFDSYVGYAQNYYLYQDNLGRFNPIIWDLNMSFASYRLTDASDSWSGFNIVQATTIDPLQHINSVSVQPRPLLRNLLANATFQRMYLAHMRTIIGENFINQEYFTRGQDIQNSISASVIADTNKFYSDADFTNNLTTTVSDLVDYPGITELMDARSTYLMNSVGFTGAPSISQINYSPAAASSGDDIWINAKIEDASLNVMLAYRFAESELFTVIAMTDDGSQNDGLIGDSVYGAQINNIANLVQYYIYAENDSAGMFAPERAAYEYFEIESDIGFQDLVINEIMANNSYSEEDQDGDYDDWIELYNNTNYQISTNRLHLSDNANQPLMWSLPDMIVEPNSYLIVWADADTTQLGLHANFKLNSEGESVWLSYDNGNVIDSLNFEEQYAMSTIGRLPNGIGNFVEMSPTFNSLNKIAEEDILTKDIFLFPNPATTEVYLKNNSGQELEIILSTLDGRNVLWKQTDGPEGLTTINTAQFSAGIYLMHIKYGQSELIKKLIITNKKN